MASSDLGISLLEAGQGARGDTPTRPASMGINTHVRTRVGAGAVPMSPKDSDMRSVADMEHPHTPYDFSAYWRVCIVAAAFYTVPALEFVITRYRLFYYHHVPPGEVDRYACFYNNKCLSHVGMLRSFNNVASNVAYLFVAAVSMLLVRRLPGAFAPPPPPAEHSGVVVEVPVSVPTGVPADRGLLLCVVLMVGLEGVLSAVYHVCPSRVNTQFDYAFIVSAAAMVVLVLYHKRHRDRTPRAHTSLTFLGVVVGLNAIDALGWGGGWFWTTWIAVCGFTTLAVSAHVYFHGRWALDRYVVHRVLRRVRKHVRVRGRKPLRNAAKFWLLVVWNVAVMGIAVGCALAHTRFFVCVMGQITLTMLLYFGNYLAGKLQHGERLLGVVWVLLIGNACVWALAVFFFSHTSYNEYKSVAESNKLNTECVFAGVFSYHDVWHLLSALGCMLTLMLVVCLDLDVAHTPRTAIAVF